MPLEPGSRRTSRSRTRDDLVGALPPACSGSPAPGDTGLGAGPLDARLATHPTLATGLLDALDSHIAVVEPSGRIVAVNAAWEAFAADNGGVDVGPGADYFAACGTSSDPTAAQALHALHQVADGRVSRASLEYPCHGPKEQRWFRMLVHRAVLAGASYLIVRHDPITAEQLTREAVATRAALLDAVDAAAVGVGLDGVVQVWNEGAAQLWGWPVAQAVGRHLADLLVPVHRAAATYRALAAVIARGSWEGELTLLHRDGHDVTVHLRLRVLHDADGAPRSVALVAVDLGERVAVERDLVRSNAWLRAITDRLGEGLCTLGPDGRIGYVNPVGHHLLGGDHGRVLGGSFTNRLLGTREDGSARAPDELLIGEEFAGTVAGEVTLDRLLRSDGSTIPIEYVATELPSRSGTEPSGWVVSFRDVTDRLAQEQRLREDAEHARWMARIQEALEQDHFVLYAQPIIEVATRRTVQHELLLRLQDPDEGLIAPGVFLPIAETYGLAPAIDRWVIGRAVALAAAGHAVELNVSARSLSDRSLVYEIERLLAHAQVDPALLVFEITGTALLDNREGAARFATRLRELGCQLALDDFGTGYGALTYLKHLPVDVLKIDIDFVRDVRTSLASRHVIAAVVALARAFDLLTVAEGVEDEDTFTVLAELGVDQAQGYHLGRPAPLDETLLAGS